MLHCTNCGRKLKGGENFCPACGTALGSDYARLVPLARAGDREAIGALYELTYRDRYYVALKYMKNHEQAEDVLQEAYIKAFSSLDQLQDPERFPSWLAMIVANTAKNELRKTRPLLFADFYSEDFSDEPPLPLPEEIDRAPQPEEAYLEKERAELVRELLDTLNEEQRLCVMMYYLDSLSIREIAETLGLNDNTVKSRLFKARRALNVKAEEMKKQGYVFSVAPLPLLLWYLRALQAAETVSIPPLGVLSTAVGSTGTAAAKLGVTAAKGGVSAASSAAGSTGAAAAAFGGKGAAGVFFSGLAGKLTAAALAVTVLGGTVYGVSTSRARQSRPPGSTSPAGYSEASQRAPFSFFTKPSPTPYLDPNFVAETCLWLYYEEVLIPEKGLIPEVDRTPGAVFGYGKERVPPRGDQEETLAYYLLRWAEKTNPEGTIYHGIEREEISREEYEAHFPAPEQKGILEAIPADFDEDGQRELLVFCCEGTVWEDPYYYPRLSMELYALENNRVILRERHVFAAHTFEIGRLNNSSESVRGNALSSIFACRNYIDDRGRDTYYMDLVRYDGGWLREPINQEERRGYMILFDLKVGRFKHFSRLKYGPILDPYRSAARALLGEEQLTPSDHPSTAQRDREWEEAWAQATPPPTATPEPPRPTPTEPPEEPPEPTPPPVSEALLALGNEPCPYAPNAQVSFRAETRIRRVTLDFGEISLLVYFERPVFEETTEGYARSNAFFADMEREFISRDRSDDIANVQRSPGMNLENRYAAEIIEDGRFFSVSHAYTYALSTAMHPDNKLRYYTFDAASGERMSLPELLGMSEDAVRAAIREALFAKYDYLSRDSERNTVLEVTGSRPMQDFNFYVRNGECHVYFNYYELAAYAYGDHVVSFPIP